jgi:hypothetical protein
MSNNEPAFTYEPIYKYDDFEPTDNTILQRILDTINNTYEHIVLFKYFDNIKRFYQHATKLYIRIYKPTGHWYIGTTSQAYSIFRHTQDMATACGNKDNSKRIVFYRQKLSHLFSESAIRRTIKENARNPNFIITDDFEIVTIAQFDNKSLAEAIELGFINSITNPRNKAHSKLSIDLCLNTIGVYKEPKKSK